MDLNAFWLNLFPSNDRVAAEISGFCRRHKDHSDLGLTWEMFKAFLLIAEVTGIKSKTNDIREQTKQMVSRLEVEFIADPSNADREAWLTAQEAVDWLTREAADRKRFFNRHAFFEEGEQTGHLLAKIVKASQMSPSIGALCTEGGRLVNTPAPIMKELMRFYYDLYYYRSRVTYSTTDSWPLSEL